MPGLGQDREPGEPGRAAYRGWDVVKMSAIGDGMPRWRARFDPKRSIAEDREGQTVPADAGPGSRSRTRRARPCCVSRMGRGEEKRYRGSHVALEGWFRPEAVN